MTTWHDYKKEIDKNGTLKPNWFILGIDLGTTNSVISYYNNETKEPQVIDVSHGFGKVTLPSVVQLRPTKVALGPLGENLPTQGEWVIGNEAQRTIKLYPRSTVRNVKSLMGSGETIKILNKPYSPEEISAKILIELIGNIYDINPNAEIAGLVVSVPYDFGQTAKKATLNAIEIAGLKNKLITLIEEPKAAALAYSFANNLNLNENIMVFDFGGGTLDITIFQVVEKTKQTTVLNVISQGGAINHGGDNIDNILTGYLNKKYTSKTGLEVETLQIENQLEIVTLARDTKERLSHVATYKVPFSFAMPPFMEKVDRPFFEELIKPLIQKTKNLVIKSIEESYTGELKKENISRILLEGGSSGMPWVKSLLSDIFDSEKIFVSKTPALDISLGATYYAAIKMGILYNKDLEIPIEIDTTLPHDIGIEIEDEDGVRFFEIIPRGTSFALAKKSYTFTLFNDTKKIETLEIKVLERKNKDDNHNNLKTLGLANIVGIPVGNRGKTKVTLTLYANENMSIKGRVRSEDFDQTFEI